MIKVDKEFEITKDLFFYFTVVFGALLGFMVWFGK